jgi:diacylglycerol kinase family enzyme
MARGLLVVAFANGYCYGGGYYCAPEAKIDDGLIDVCLIKKVGKLKAAGFMKVYREGKHHSPENPR